MLVISDLADNYDELEKVVNTHTFNALFEMYNGYNLIDNEDEKEFDFELDDCIFTIRQVPYVDHCVLCNDFQIHINDEWIDFERW